MIRNLDYALACARRGWLVIPLHWAELLPTPTCSCGKPCASVAKHPMVKSGLLEGTTDASQIRTWWDRWPHANVGVVTGRESNLLVIDVDLKSDGPATWKELCQKHSLPKTVTVATGGGGEHYYFLRPETHVKLQSRAGVAKGIDVRCDGGYVVAPPSLHKSGSRYEFQLGSSPNQVELAPCPEWCVDMLVSPTKKRPISTGESRDTGSGQKRPISTGESRDTKDGRASPSSHRRGRGWVYVAFEADGRILRELGSGRASVRCPWESEHSTPQVDGDTSCVVFDANPDHNVGKFHCSHSHCSGRTLVDIRRALSQHAVGCADRAYPPQRPSTTGESRDTLSLDERGRPTKCLHNILTILTSDHRWKGVLARDTFGGVDLCVSPPWDQLEAPAVQSGRLEDDDATRLVTWLHRYFGLKVSKDMCSDALAIAAQRTEVHPVREYLDALAWDGTIRLATAASTYWGADPADAHAATAIVRWLISAVRRIYEPGCQCDSMLVLEGRQGVGKSQSVRRLAGRWHSDNVGDISNKDSADSLRGVWMCEIAELAWSKKEEDVRKAFISRQIDRYRPSYARRTIDVPRQCVFVGTTNATSWQTDETGARRYWVVPCGRIDLVALARDRDQLLGEAVARYQSGEPSYLVAAELDQHRTALAARRDLDPWEPAIVEYLVRRDECTVSELLERVGLDLAHRGQAEARRVARLLRALGWVQTERRSSMGRMWETSTEKKEVVG